MSLFDGNMSPADIAAVDQFGNVTSTTYLSVPNGCCSQISVRNSSETNEPILVRNANLVITRIA